MSNPKQVCLQPSMQFVVDIRSFDIPSSGVGSGSGSPTAVRSRATNKTLTRKQ